MKYLAKSQNNKMIQIGDDIKRGKWFYVTDAVTEVFNSLVIGEEVTFVAEPRGGGFYLSFLSKGNVQIPEQFNKKQEVAPVTTQVNTAPSKPFNPPQGGTGVPYKKEEKVDWDGKERRDFKGRSIAYASSAMSLIRTQGTINEQEYLEQLLRIAKKIEEYIYEK